MGKRPEQTPTKEVIQMANRYMKRRYTTAVPNLFGTRDQFRGRQFFHGLDGGAGGWFRL